MRVSIEDHPAPAAPDVCRWACFNSQTLKRVSGWMGTEAEALRACARRGWSVADDTLFAIGDPTPAPVVEDRRSGQLALDLGGSS